MDTLQKVEYYTNYQTYLIILIDGADNIRLVHSQAGCLSLTQHRLIFNTLQTIIQLDNMVHWQGAPCRCTLWLFSRVSACNYEVWTFKKEVWTFRGAGSQMLSDFARVVQRGAVIIKYNCLHKLSLSHEWDVCEIISSHRLGSNACHQSTVIMSNLHCLLNIIGLRPMMMGYNV